jgi:hypothetical protein
MTSNPRRAYDSNRQEIPPMTLGGMRALGVRSIGATCAAIGCGHEATLDVDGLADELPVPNVALRLRCTQCGGRDIRTRPDWREMHAAGMAPARR